MHIEAIGFAATQPNTGLAATAFSGDSLTVKHCKSGARILAWWSDHQVVGSQTLIWPSAHDTTRNLRVGVEPSELKMNLPLGLPPIVHPQETMSVSIVGSNTAGDVEQGCLLMMYDDAPGIDANLIGVDELLKRFDKLVTVNGSITTTAGPAWTGSELINAESDLLRANREYALLGANFETECLALGVRAPDWGNARVAIPGIEDDRSGLTSSWFKTLSAATGLKTIPVFNSANRNDIRIDAAQDENAAAVPFTLFLALLK